MSTACSTGLAGVAPTPFDVGSLATFRQPGVERRLAQIGGQRLQFLLPRLRRCERRMLDIHSGALMRREFLQQRGLAGDVVVQRHRVDADASDRFVERLFGLELTQAQYDRGERFVQGVIERAGAEGLARLWDDAANLPTPAEVDAPGLWLARIDLPLD